VFELARAFDVGLPGRHQAVGGRVLCASSGPFALVQARSGGGALERLGRAVPDDDGEAQLALGRLTSGAVRVERVGELRP
jgi:hypothetical protein